MARHRTLTKKNPYYLPRETFLTALYFAQLYQYEQQGEQGRCFPGESEAEKEKRIHWRIQATEQSVNEAAPAILREWVLRAVTTDAAYKDLSAAGIPCSKEELDVIRQRFYWVLADKLGLRWTGPV